jgi:hypothetical protein
MQVADDGARVDDLSSVTNRVRDVLTRPQVKLNEILPNSTCFRLQNNVRQEYFARQVFG